MTPYLKVSHTLKYVSAVLFFAGMLLAGFFGDQVKAEHTEQFKASGYAYGSIDKNEDGNTETGIGYMSFGCESDTGSACEATASTNFPTGYGVRINTNPGSDDEGKFFGYAWSSNYGWVSFYHNDVSVCDADANTNVGGLEIQGDVQNFIHTPGSTASLKGYARVLNYDNSEWNGCIRFSGQAEDGSGYTTNIESLANNNLQLSGWAWGSELIGWISFDCQYCDVEFTPVETECEESDDPEECAPEGPQSGLALYVGGENSSNPEIVGNSTYTYPVIDIGESADVKLIPQAFGQEVGACSASSSGNSGAVVTGWNGPLPSLDPLAPEDITNDFIASISNYDIGEIVTFTINCTSLLDNSPVSAEAFVTLQFPEASVSIDADPNPIDVTLDPGGTTTLSWNFDNVQDNSCEIIGAVDFTPSIDDDPLEIITPAFAEDIGFTSWSPNNPGDDDLFGIVNFPVWFQITCQDYADEFLSDDVYITTTDLGCTGSMEAAGYCSNDINPIFEEF